MLNWLKRLLGIAPAAPISTENKVVREEPPAPPKPKTPPKKTQTKKTTTKKAAPKKKAAVDLSSMKKDELLAHAKKAGVKANASMKKDEILAAINNG